MIVTDAIAPAAIDILRRNADTDVRVGLQPVELLSMIGQYHAIVVRSQTKVTRQIIDAGTRLEVIGRAGVGVDNIDVDAATRRGIFVINSPAGQHRVGGGAHHGYAARLSPARSREPAPSYGQESGIAPSKGSRSATRCWESLAWAESAPQ